jgi:hypothetical protein
VRFAAGLLSAWAASRWVGFVVGAARARRFEGGVRKQARRTVVAHGAVTMFVSAGAFYAWAFALDLQPAETLVGFIAAALMIALALGLANALMQPAERTPETIGICRLRRPRVSA